MERVRADTKIGTVFGLVWLVWQRNGRKAVAIDNQTTSGSRDNFVHDAVEL
jgi:hypothetical protein